AYRPWEFFIPPEVPFGGSEFDPVLFWEILGQVSREALAEALQKGHLGGAALDVFSQEPPPPDHPLLQLDNVIATPHIGGNTHDVIRHQSRIIVEDLIRLFESRSPKYCVNPQVLDSFSI
ncbi:MAG: NAD(P)-dependent oxidoreductase, partial [Dethiobacteria bacterium]